MNADELDNLNDRHTPYAHVTGWQEPQSEEEVEDALDALAFQKAIDEDCGCRQPLDDFLAGEDFPCPHEYSGCE